jgi:ubiquinone/menaquinone biosynthesis C-methylase UbiE
MVDFNEKSKSEYNKKADDYDNSPEGRFTLKYQRLLVSEIVLCEKYSVLDVACGTGSLLAALNRKTPINGFGIDISDCMIKNAATNNRGMEFHEADCEKIPFGNGTMDIITVCAAYHHFPDTAAFAREAQRILKPNGKVYIAEIYLPSVLRLLVNPFVPLSKAGDVKFYSPKVIVGSFELFGFEKEAVKITDNIQIVSCKKVK